jgi:peptidoglycan/LPS O-acetylase OafA/YrhL
MDHPSHKNNFDFLRLLFSVAVLFSHCYPLSGTAAHDPLWNLTSGQVECSALGVRGFFAISGFLVIGSLLRSRGFLDYLWKRVLRLFPGLLVCLVLTVLLGPFVYDEAVGSYWSNPAVWSYVPNNLSLYSGQFNIVGFFTTNPYQIAINGSLWTLPYEFTMYLILACLVFVRKFPKVLKAILVGLQVGCIVGVAIFLYWLAQYEFGINLGHQAEFASYFLGGALLALFRFERFRYMLWLMLASLLIIVAALYFELFYRGFGQVFLPILVVGCGLQSTRYLRDLDRYVGDLSYGAYIYGFLVQQALEYFYRLDLVEMMLFSLPLTLTLGYFSWHLVEKQALKLKKFAPTFF